MKTHDVDSELIALGQALEAPCARWRADPEDDAAHAECTAIAKRMIAMAAHSLEGLAAKGRALDWCYSGDPIADDELGESTDARLAVSVVRDLLALQRAA